MIIKTLTTVLSKFNRELKFVPPTERLVYVQRFDISGFDLEQDLKVLLNREDPLIFDVGANRGQTIELLCRIFDSPHIFAFEPSNSAFEILSSQNFNANVILNRMALEANPGKSTSLTT